MFILELKKAGAEQQNGPCEVMWPGEHGARVRSQVLGSRVTAL